MVPSLHPKHEVPLPEAETETTDKLRFSLYSSGVEISENLFVEMLNRKMRSSTIHQMLPVELITIFRILSEGITQPSPGRDLKHLNS